MISVHDGRDILTLFWLKWGKNTQMRFLLLKSFLLVNNIIMTFQVLRRELARLSGFAGAALRAWAAAALLLLLAVAAVHALPVRGLAAEAEGRGQVRVGILANRGLEKCPEDWGAMMSGLREAMPHRRIFLVPLRFEDVEGAVAGAFVDFVVVNPSMYVDLEVRYDISRIATLVNRVGGASSAMFGGVFVARAERDDIRTLRDARGKRLAATSRFSLGGWLLGWDALRGVGVDPTKDLASLSFAGTHDKVVEDVLAGRSDLGTVRTDTLERMMIEGRLDPGALKVVLPTGFKADPSFPFLYSTRLVPEWPFAKLAHTPDSLAREVAAALLLMREKPGAGPSGREWTVPLSYESIHLIMRELRVPPYENYGVVTLKDFLRQHVALVLPALAMFVVLAVSVAHLRRLNKRLRQAMGKLRDAEAELIAQANTDILTGLRNRKRFNEIVERELARALRYDRPLSMLLMDLDNFKHVNDRHGHPAGDAALVAAAGIITSSLRASDFAARIGGEEFAVLLPETGLEEAAQAAERIRAAMGEAVLALDGEGGEVRCTVSVGVADVCRSIQNYSALYSAADQALYKAKARGRDRVEKSSVCTI